MKPLTDEQSVDLALPLTKLQRQVILLCAQKQSIGYERIANTLNVPYGQVQQAGRSLQAKKLAYVSPVRNILDNYAGSALFLNPRGEQVRHVVELQERLGARA